jgi:hypothetical protein
VAQGLENMARGLLRRAESTGNPRRWSRCDRHAQKDVSLPLGSLSPRVRTSTPGTKLYSTRAKQRIMSVSVVEVEDEQRGGVQLLQSLVLRHGRLGKTACISCGL